MSHSSSLSLVVPTLGSSPWLEASLRGLRVDGGRELELILVCPEGVRLSPEVASLISRRVDSSGELGFAPAVNLGFAATQPRVFLGTVNDDAVVEPGWCRLLVAALTDHPQAGSAQGLNLISMLHEEQTPASSAGVAPAATVPTNDRVDGAGLGWNRWSQAVQIGHGQPVAKLMEEQRAILTPAAKATCHQVFGVSATAAIYRRVALDGAALRTSYGAAQSTTWFDPRFESYYEDVDLAVRLSAQRWQALFVPAARTRHLGSATGLSLGRRREALLIANRWLTLRRALGPALMLHAPRMLLRDLAAVKKGEVGAVALVMGWARFVRLAPRLNPLPRAQRAALPPLRAGHKRSNQLGRRGGPANGLP